MARYEIAPGESEVRLRAETSLRPLTLVATEIGGFIDGEFATDGSLHGCCECSVHLLVGALHSGNAVLDDRAARHFDSERHPEISAELRSLAPWAVVGQYEASWQLAFHGIARDVPGLVTIARPDRTSIRLDGGQVIDVRNWGVSLPSLRLVRVHPDVRFAVHLVARTRGRPGLDRRPPSPEG